MSEQGFRAPEAKRIAGITYRQLDYWTRTGLVTPSVKDAGSGTQRLYSFQDLATLKVIKKLLDTGVSLQRVRKAVELLRSMDRRPRGHADVRRHGGLRGTARQAVVDLLNDGQGVSRSPSTPSTATSRHGGRVGDAARARRAARGS